MEEMEEHHPPYSLATILEKPCFYKIMGKTNINQILQ